VKTDSLCFFFFTVNWVVYKLNLLQGLSVWGSRGGKLVVVFFIKCAMSWVVNAWVLGRVICRGGHLVFYPLLYNFSSFFPSWAVPDCVASLCVLLNGLNYCCGRGSSHIHPYAKIAVIKRHTYSMYCNWIAILNSSVCGHNLQVQGLD